MNALASNKSQSALSNQILQVSTVARTSTSLPEFYALVDANSNLTLPSAITSLANSTTTSISSTSTEETAIVVNNKLDLSFNNKSNSSSIFNQVQCQEEIAYYFTYALN